MTNKHQKGFVFRQENCIGCSACAIACQVYNELPENQRFRKIDRYEVKKPDGTVDLFFSHACMHCGNPACLMVCPAKAYTIRHDGIVILDREKCTGCGLCVSACPYDAVSMNLKDGLAAKCNMCVERLDAGMKPACVDGCPVGCLDVDNVSQALQVDYASKNGIGYGDCVTKPNLVIIKKRMG